MRSYAARIHLVMALCYTTTACGELLLQSLEAQWVLGTGEIGMFLMNASITRISLELRKDR